MVVIWSHKTHIALSLQILARRVRQSVAPGGKRIPHRAKVRSDYVQIDQIKQSEVTIKVPSSK